MDILFEYLQGKKWYIMTIITGVAGLAQSQGYVLPEWFWWLDAMGMSGAVRSALGKSEVNAP